MSATTRLAMITLDEAESVLDGLPEDPEVLLLVERWRELRRVVYGVCVHRVPLFVTQDQEAALLTHCLRLAAEVNNLADLLCPMEASGTRRAWGAAEKLRRGVA
jgi:hypothetical protein